MENSEAICCFGEAIAFYDYSVSSGPFFCRFEIVIGPGPGPDRYQSSTIFIKMNISSHLIQTLSSYLLSIYTSAHPFPEFCTILKHPNGLADLMELQQIPFPSQLKLGHNILYNGSINNFVFCKDHIFSILLRQTFK